MAVRIRLAREGRRNRASFRVVAMESRDPQSGRALEILGSYDPLPNPPRIQVNRERALHWLRHGALPTEAAQWVLETQGIWQEHTGKPGTMTAGAASAGDPEHRRGAAPEAPASDTPTA